MTIVNTCLVFFVCYMLYMYSDLICLPLCYLDTDLVLLGLELFTDHCLPFVMFLTQAFALLVISAKTIKPRISCFWHPSSLFMAEIIPLTGCE